MHKNKIYFFLIAIFSLILLDGCDLGKKGESKKAQDQGKTEPVTTKDCGSLTAKGASDCEKKDAISGKVCVWEFDECAELTPALKDFRSADQTYEVAMPAAGGGNLATDQVLGASHGEAPDWERICGAPGVRGGTKTLIQALDSLTLVFKKDTKEVTLSLDCSRAGGGLGNKTYDFSYTAKTLDDKSLLLKLDSKGFSIIGSFDGPRVGNLLEFFSKADYMVTPDKTSLIGIIQLGNMGYRAGYPMLKLTTKKEFDDAIAYARDATKGGGYELAKVGGQDVGGVSFVYQRK